MEFLSKRENLMQINATQIANVRWNNRSLAKEIVIFLRNNELHILNSIPMYCFKTERRIVLVALMWSCYCMYKRFVYDGVREETYDNNYSVQLYNYKTKQGIF